MKASFKIRQITLRCTASRQKNWHRLRLISSCRASATANHHTLRILSVPLSWRMSGAKNLASARNHSRKSSLSRFIRSALDSSSTIRLPLATSRKNAHAATRHFLRLQSCHRCSSTSRSNSNKSRLWHSKSKYMRPICPAIQICSTITRSLFRERIMDNTCRRSRGASKSCITSKISSKSSDSSNKILKD